MAYLYNEEHIDNVYELIFLSAMPLIIIINASLFCTSWYLYVYLITDLNETETCSSSCLKAAVIDGQVTSLPYTSQTQQNVSF